MKNKKALLDRLAEEGLTSSYDNFILKYEKLGQLKCRRDKINGYRKFTDAEIEGIIAAYKKDGRSFKYYCQEK